MVNTHIQSLELERYVLSGVLRFPETFIDIDGYLNEDDFVNNLHKTIFGVIRQTMRNKEKIETVLVATKINNLSLSFEDKVSNILDYLNDLKLIQIQAKGVKDIAQELRLVTMRRHIAETGIKLAEEMRRHNSKATPQEILSVADNIVNGNISIWDSSAMKPEDIGSDLEECISSYSTKKEAGLKGPYPLLQRMYGSILRPSNITVFCARAGSGKTTLLNDLTYKTSALNSNCPIFHMDAGEMLKEELQLRMVASISGVSLNYIESGLYKQDPETVKVVLSAIQEIKKIPFYYYNVASLSTEQILTTLRRFYLSKIGRGGKMIFSYDYLKSYTEKNQNNKAEYEVMGGMLTKFKDFITSEVKVPMVTAVQANRSGIVTGRASANVQDDEGIISGSDRIAFYASQVFILRKKTYDELQAEAGKFGSHKVINIKARHLGEDVKRALAMVKLPDGTLRNNYVNVDITNFQVTEKQDLSYMAQQLSSFNISNKPTKSNVEI